MLGGQREKDMFCLRQLNRAAHLLVELLSLALRFEDVFIEREEYRRTNVMMEIWSSVLLDDQRD